MKRFSLIYGISAGIILIAFGFALFFTFTNDAPISMEDAVAQARSQQPAVSAGVQHFQIDPHDVEMILNVQGTINGKPSTLQVISTRDNAQYFFYPQTGEVTKTPPSDFIFPDL